MPWVNLDDQMPEKVWTLSDEAFRLHIAALCHCARFNVEAIPRDRVARLVPSFHERAAEELVDEQIWILFESGFVVTGKGRDWKTTKGVTNRPRIPSYLRAAVMERDDRKCKQCGALDSLSIDHIWPWSKGGRNTLDNLQVLCRSCNSRKGARV